LTIIFSPYYYEPVGGDFYVLSLFQNPVSFGQALGKTGQARFFR
jgi:hypothetical protein